MVFWINVCRGKQLLQFSEMGPFRNLSRFYLTIGQYLDSKFCVFFFTWQFFHLLTTRRGEPQTSFCGTLGFRGTQIEKHCTNVYTSYHFRAHSKWSRNIFAQFTSLSRDPKCLVTPLLLYLIYPELYIR